MKRSPIKYKNSTSSVFAFISAPVSIMKTINGRWENSEALHTCFGVTNCWTWHKW